MDISESNFDIEYENNLYYLLIDGEKLKTPQGNYVAHHEVRLIRHIYFDLECEKELNTISLNTYSLFCLTKDVFELQENQIDKETFRKLILNDNTMKCSAGPEKLEQFKKWNGLFEQLDILNMDYPDIIQISDINEIEEWIISNGDNYSKKIDEFVDHFYKEFNMLSACQKSAALVCYNAHSSIIYGMLLSMKKCNVFDYTAAILASDCIIPNVFFDISKKKYKKTFNALKTDSTTISNFVEIYLTPEKKLAFKIKNEITNWAFLPEGTKISLIEAINRIEEAKSDDYSAFIMLAGKSLEIALKELIFDEFQEKEGKLILEHKEINLFLKENEIIIKLAKFVIKSPPFIELGSMLFILEKHEGKTSKNNILLKSFFDYLNETGYINILKKDWIENAKKILEYRNKAAHSKRYELKEAKEILKITINLLKEF